MLDRLTGKSVHGYIHLLGCILLAAGLPTSKIPLSLGTMLLALNFLLQADFRRYMRNLRSNKAAWGLWLFIAFELLSVLWSVDKAYALNDLRIKAPLYVIPLILIADPVTDRKRLYLIVGFFLAALFLTSFVNIGTYLHWWGDKVYDDIRGLSLFESHIRYALMIGMGVAFCAVWLLLRLPYRLIAALLAAWWIWYTYFAQVISGYMALAAVALALLLYAFARIRRRNVRLSLTGVTLALLLAGSWWTIQFFRPEPHRCSMKNPDRYTVNGNKYHTDLDTIIWENGYPVIAFICEKELAPAWNKRSDIDYFTGKDQKQQHIYFTLWRYMASKGLRKDSLGLAAMTSDDIHNVEKGIASVRLLEGGFVARLYSIKNQIEHPENPNGHSLLQRLEYWKAARHIIHSHWLTGVGSGDVQHAFDDYYATHPTRLIPELRLRAHNQYMTSMISSGIGGLLAFILWWALMLRLGWKKRSVAFLAFAGIALSSFLIEDTLETQMGVTFVAFFAGLFTGFLRETE